MCIAQGLLFIGSLDPIAPVLTMFFLITFASCNPTWRECSWY
jgi:hypothetical protein